MVSIVPNVDGISRPLLQYLEIDIQSNELMQQRLPNAVAKSRLRKFFPKISFKLRKLVK